MCIGTSFSFFTWFHVFSADSHVFRCLDIYFSYAHVFLGFSADGNVFLCFLFSIRIFLTVLHFSKFLEFFSVLFTFTSNFQCFTFLRFIYFSANKHVLSFV